MIFGVEFVWSENGYWHPVDGDYFEQRGWIIVDPECVICKEVKKENETDKPNTPAAKPDRKQREKKLTRTGKRV